MHTRYCAYSWDLKWGNRGANSRHLYSHHFHCATFLKFASPRRASLVLACTSGAVAQKVAQVPSYALYGTYFLSRATHIVVKLLFNAGWLINIKSMTKLYDSIVKTDEMMFICTYKLGQDPLETFFSSIRMKLGCGNNPTSIQFRAAFESLLCNTLNHKVLLSRQISKPAFYKCFHDLQYPQKKSHHGEKKMAYYNRPNFFPK